jgi:hypothetical protein
MDPVRQWRIRLTAALLLASSSCAQAEPAQVNTISEAFAKLGACWRPPDGPNVNPDIDITVIVSFRRDGSIFGRPRITYESPEATDRDRMQYRIAVMEALQRCTPMPFTESMAGAVAGRPFAIKFHSERRSPQTEEKRVWLAPKIL